MKSSSIVASILACVAIAHAQGPESPCTFTSTQSVTISGPTETITVHIGNPFTTTTTNTIDCSGCEAAAVSTTAVFVGPSVTATTFVYTVPQATVTGAVCSPTPSA